MPSSSNVLQHYEILSVADEGAQLEQFARSVQQGLSLPNKQLNAMYFYDDVGSQLYNQITRLPEYYLTNSEMEIFQQHGQAICQHFVGQPFNLIEFGPGEGQKTAVLLETLHQQKQRFQYVPMDIAEEYIEALINKFSKAYPQQAMLGIVTDFFQGVEWLKQQENKRQVILFIGSSIGNFADQDAEQFLQALQQSLNPGDWLLIGFDLQKELKQLQAAYDDSQGITRQFNFNLLERINRQLGGTFQLDQFEHCPVYNPRRRVMESYLVSTCQQRVSIAALDQTFEFEAWEAIFVEQSAKYNLQQIEQMAEKSGFQLQDTFFDQQHRFAVSLWQVPV